jgi:hypothetical protein
MGRPTKLTPELCERVGKALRAGNYAEAAARACDISPASYYRWIQRGESEQSGIYHEFAAEVRKAEAEAEVHAVAILRRAMPEDWRAALAYLERRHPGRWRRRTTTEVTGSGGGPIRTESGSTAELELGKLSDEELALFEELHRRAQPD